MPLEDAVKQLAEDQITAFTGDIVRIGGSITLTKSEVESLLVMTKLEPSSVPNAVKHIVEELTKHRDQMVELFNHARKIYSMGLRKLFEEHPHVTKIIWMRDISWDQRSFGTETWPVIVLDTDEKESDAPGYPYNYWDPEDNMPEDTKEQEEYINSPRFVAARVFGEYNGQFAETYFFKIVFPDKAIIEVTRQGYKAVECPRPVKAEEEESGESSK